MHEVSTADDCWHSLLPAAPPGAVKKLPDSVKILGGGLLKRHLRFGRYTFSSLAHLRSQPLSVPADQSPCANWRWSIDRIKTKPAQ